MIAPEFPCIIFKTQKWMDDYSASDMRCGDLGIKLPANSVPLCFLTSSDHYPANFPLTDRTDT